MAADFIVSGQDDCLEKNYNLFGGSRFNVLGDFLALAGLQVCMNGQVNGFSAASSRVGK
jgi:hypothetical protein